MTDWPPRAAGDAPRRDGDGAPATRVVHAGLPAAEQGTPFLPGPVFAAPYHLIGPSDASRYGYARYANPTWSGYEDAIGELEGGGEGAAGCHARVGRDAIQPGPRRARRRRARRRAHAAGALLAIDNTLATPLLQRPLQLGADLSITSASKGLTGHSDLVLGYVVAADPARAEALRHWRGLTGAIAGPFETWLAHRSLATLDVRHERQCANALALAEALAARSDVRGVVYPGLPGHPAHALAACTYGGERFGSVLCFDLETEARAQRSCRPPA